MRKWMQRTMVGALAMLGPVVAGTALAEPLDLANVPADSKWVIHVDMDAVRESASWPAIYARLQKLPMFDAKVAQMEQIFNARFPEDLHAVTVIGSGFDEDNNIVQVHAGIDRTGLEKMLNLNPGYASSTHGSHSVMCWDDNGKTMFGSFLSDDRFFVGHNKDRVEAVLDVVDNKGAALKTGSTLAQGARPGLLVYVAGDGLAKLKQEGAAKSPVLAQMQSAWAALSEVKEDILLQIKVQADTVANAERMRKSVDGIIAMLSLAADNANAKPGVKLLASLTDNVQAKVEQTVVSVEWRLAQSRLPKLIEEALNAKAEAEKTH